MGGSGLDPALSVHKFHGAMVVKRDRGTETCTGSATVNAWSNRYAGLGIGAARGQIFRPVHWHATDNHEHEAQFGFNIWHE